MLDDEPFRTTLIAIFISLDNLIMITFKLVNSIKSYSLLFKFRQPIISSLFRKKYEAEAPKAPAQPEEVDKK